LFLPLARHLHLVPRGIAFSLPLAPCSARCELRRTSHHL
jgi:hypothetical protein